MPRQRFIWPSLWTDETIAELSREERLLFIALFSLADDEGRINANPRWLKGVVFPFDDDLSADDVRRMRDHIVQVCRRSVRLYQVDGREYIALLRWKKWQKPKYPTPSQIPPPPEDGSPTEEASGNAFSQPTGDACDRSLSIPGILPEDSRNAAEAFPYGMGRDGMDRDGVGRGTGEPPASESDDSSPADSPEPPPAVLADEHMEDATPTERAILGELKRVRGYPFDFARDLEFVRALAVDYPSVDLLEEAKKWRTYKLDRPLAKKSNPRSQFRNWVRIAAERLARDSPRRAGQVSRWHYNDGGGPIPF